MIKRIGFVITRRIWIILFLTFLSELALGQSEIPATHSFCGELVRHTYFSLSYVEEHEQAEWVTYTLTPEFLKTNVKRSDKFIEDPKVSTGSAKLSDFKGSGFDRGHLVPAADMAYSSNGMRETFYLSNISPQDPSFNRGIWKKLEIQVREWGSKFKIYVVAGGIFNKKINEPIGNSGVTVPGEFFKIIYAPSVGEMIGFIIPNEKSKLKISSFIKTVDEIEELTGTNYFMDLPEDLQNKLESEINPYFWGTVSLN